MQQISRDKLDCFLRATTGFTLCVLDRYGLRDHGPARPTLTPQIRFLYIGSRFCSALPSDPASQRRPCASLSLHLYQVVKRTFTSKLSNMRGVPKIKRGSRAAPPFAILLCRLRSALTARMFRERLAPLERCAQFWFSSKSGGVMSPPELIELSSPVYSPATPFASKEWANTQIPQTSIFVFLI